VAHAQPPTVQRVNWAGHKRGARSIVLLSPAWPPRVRLPNQVDVYTECQRCTLITVIIHACICAHFGSMLAQSAHSGTQQSQGHPHNGRRQEQATLLLNASQAQRHRAQAPHICWRKVHQVTCLLCPVSSTAGCAHIGPGQKAGTADQASTFC
jgi:hypothetical protein